MCMFGDLSLQMVMDPSFLAHSSKKCLKDEDHQEAIEAYLMVRRSEEDVIMLENEAQNVVHFYEDKKKAILTAMEQASDGENLALSLGAKCLLHELLLEVDDLLVKAQNVTRVMQSNDVETLNCEMDSDSSSCDEFDE